MEGCGSPHARGLERKRVKRARLAKSCAQSVSRSLSRSSKRSKASSRSTAASCKGTEQSEIPNPDPACPLAGLIADATVASLDGQRPFSVTLQDRTGTEYKVLQLLTDAHFCPPKFYVWIRRGRFDCKALFGKGAARSSTLEYSDLDSAIQSYGAIYKEDTDAMWPKRPNPGSRFVLNSYQVKHRPSARSSLHSRSKSPFDRRKPRNQTQQSPQYRGDVLGGPQQEKENNNAKCKATSPELHPTFSEGHKPYAGVDDDSNGAQVKPTQPAGALVRPIYSPPSVRPRPQGGQLQNICLLGLLLETRHARSVQFDILLHQVREIHALIEPSMGFLSRHRVLNVCKNHPLVCVSIDIESESTNRQPNIKFTADAANDVENTLRQDNDPSLQRMVQRVLTG